jgi:hypothetical protein
LTCFGDADCQGALGPAYACDFNELRCVFDGCRSNEECDITTEVCNLETGECVLVDSPLCTRERDCGPDEHCDYATGLCRAGKRCAFDINCPPEQRCGADNLCIDRKPCLNNLSCEIDDLSGIPELLGDEICDGVTATSQAIVAGDCVEFGIFCSNDDGCLTGDRCDIAAGRCVTGGSCQRDDYCGVAQVCDVKSRVCVYPMQPCTFDANCRDDQRCNETLKRCVTKLMCGIDFDCAETEICEPGTGNCRESDLNLACTNDDVCVTRLGLGSTCDQASGSCTQIAVPGRCQTSADCLPNELCDIGIGACIAVVVPDECDTSRPCEAGLVCTEGKCRSTEVGCDQDTDCLANEECDQGTGQCVIRGEPPSCESDADCDGSQFCNAEAGACEPVAGGAGCDSDLDCRGNEFCDPDTDECVARAEPVVVCVDPPRNEAEECPPGKVCLAAQCVAQAGGGSCSTNEDCRANEVCDITAGTCAGTPNCEGDDDCGAGFTCDVGTGLCTVRGASCVANADCGSTEVCDFVEGVCVDAGGGCGGADQCFGGQICDSATATCQFAGGPCRSNLVCCDGELGSPENAESNGTNVVVEVDTIAGFQVGVRVNIYSSDGAVTKQQNADIVAVVSHGDRSGAITIAALNSSAGGGIVPSDRIFRANAVCELVCFERIGFCSIPVSP